MRVRRFMAGLGLLLLFGVLGAAPAVAASPTLKVVATVNGHAVASSSGAHPVRLKPKVPATVQVAITNSGSNPVNVRRVELSGRVVGLTFFSFDTSVALSVAPGTTDDLSYTLDLTGLRGQATGLMGGAVTVFDDHDRQVARQAMVTDVRGSLVSVYGLFGLALLVLTVLALVDTAVAIARHGLPANRWRRGTRALTPGIGIGLVLVFTLSAAHIAVPTGPRWIEAAIGFAVLFFVLGYLTPTPDDARDDDDEYDDEYDESEGVQPAPQPAQAQHAPDGSPVWGGRDWSDAPPAQASPGPPPPVVTQLPPAAQPPSQAAPAPLVTRPAPPPLVTRPTQPPLVTGPPGPAPTTLRPGSGPVPPPPGGPG